MNPVVIEQVSAVGLLAELHACDIAERQAAARRLAIAREWVTMHPGIDTVPAEVRRSLIDDDLNMAIDAIAEFAAVHGVSTAARRDLLVDAVELRNRLPRCWQHVQALVVPAWKGIALARASRRLGDDSAAFLDGHAALLGGKLSLRRIGRLALMALARYEPDRIVDPHSRRFLHIIATSGDLDATSWLHGQLDTPDALDLETAVRQLAADLAHNGSTDRLDVRRAQALGILARNTLRTQPVLLNTHSAVPGTCERSRLTQEPAGDRGDEAGLTAIGTRTEQQDRTAVHHIGEGRPVTLYVHVSADQLTPADAATGRDGSSGTPSPLAELGNTAQLVTREHVRRWCHSAARITIRPVIDLTTDREVRGYHPSDTQREQIALRDRTCVFPHCTRPAHPIPTQDSDRCSHDVDHITPYDAGGATSTDNLACLCRRHHLLKTHTRWRYRPIGPGEYLWRSPTGLLYLRTATGTTPSDRPLDKPAAQPREGT